MGNSVPKKLLVPVTPMMATSPFTERQVTSVLVEIVLSGLPPLSNQPTVPLGFAPSGSLRASTFRPMLLKQLSGTGPGRQSVAWPTTSSLVGSKSVVKVWSGLQNGSPGFSLSSAQTA